MTVPHDHESLSEDHGLLVRLAEQARAALASGPNAAITVRIRGYWEAGPNYGTKRLWGSYGPKGRITGTMFSTTKPDERQTSPSWLAVQFSAAEVLAECVQRLQELEEDSHDSRSHY